MPLRTPLRAAALLVVLPLALPAFARAEAVRLKAADDRGVTLELAIAGYRVGPAGPDGRALLDAPGLTAHALPGRPVLPSATTLVALPPGARAVIAAIRSDPEETRLGVRLALGNRRGFAVDSIQPGDGLGPVPVAEPAEPILDGPWPPSPVELGVPFTLRGQRMVAVTLAPFRYDEASARLTATRRLEVRIAFAGGLAGTSGAPAADDPHWDPVFKQSLVNFEQGRRWRKGPTGIIPGGRARPAGARPGGARPAGRVAFDESEPEVRVQLDSTGVYVLTYDQLAAKGYPPQVPVGQVSVHRHEYVGDVDPSYDTVELPIEVDEASPANGTFDAGDRILLFAQSWAERSGASLPQRVWGDGDVVFVTRLLTGGARIGPRLGWQGLTGQTPLASYPWSQHWEKNFYFLGFPGAAPAESLYDEFHWTTLVAYYSRPETLLFEGNDVDPTRTIGFTIAWQGRRSSVPYLTWGQVRNGDYVYNTVADSVGWLGKGNLVVSATLPGDAISEGLNNSVVTWARLAGAPPSPTTNAFAPISVNWFEATYWRGFRAIKDRLPCNSGDQAGPFEVLATGFGDSSALRAYDVTDPGDPRRLTNVLRERAGSGYALRFQDDATLGPRRYVVFSQGKAVPASRVTPVTRGRLTGQSDGKYLVIVPEAWQAAVQPLVDLRRSQGHEVLVCPLEAIYDEFNGGRRSALAIKGFIRYALNTWGAQFVVLAGDGSEDPQNFLVDSGPDVIPIYRVPGPVGVPPDGRELVPSDGWYVWCLNGCDPDPGTGQPPPIVPELFIGRLPVASAQELSDLVAKLVAYENLGGDQSWRNRQLLFSDDQYSGITTFGGGGGGTDYCYRYYEERFELLNRTIRSVIVDSAGLYRSDVENFDLSYWLRNEKTDGGNPPCRLDLIATQNRTRGPGGPTEALFSRLNEGRMWWNYQGHANEYVLAHENVYRNVGSEDDKQLLTNNGRPFLFSAFSCHANAFARVLENRSDLGPALGEELVRMPARGAIASFASVGYEIIPDNGTDHLNVAWARAMFLDPPHDDLLGNGDRGARVALGETIALGLLRYIPAVDNDPTESGLALTYTLLGDPGTRLSIGMPQAIVTANGDTAYSDRPVALAPPRDTLHLEAELVSTVEIRGIALIEGGAGGSRTIPATDYTVSPAFPDTAASGLGGRRYHLSYTTPIRPGVVRYTVRTDDRYGLRNDFNLVFPFYTQLRVSDNPLAENDAVTPAADLSLKLTLPTPIADPPRQLALAVDSVAQAFVATATDTTGRQWVLRWTHDAYVPGHHRLVLTALDSLRGEHRFRVVDQLAGGEHMLREVLAFPNPFDDQLGTSYSYYLLSDGPADVLLRVFTVTGRLIFERMERGLAPGYHQWRWDGRDAEGDKLANGVYLYKMVASSGSRSDTYEGRLVKLRRPRRGDVTTP